MNDFTDWLKARIIAGFNSPGGDHHRSTTWVAMRMLQIHTDEDGVCKVCGTPFPCLTLRVCTYPYSADEGRPDQRAEGWRDEWDFAMEEIHPNRDEPFVQVWRPELGISTVMRLSDLPDTNVSFVVADDQRKGGPTA